MAVALGLGVITTTGVLVGNGAGVLGSFVGEGWGVVEGSVVGSGVEVLGGEGCNVGVSVGMGWEVGVAADGGVMPIPTDGLSVSTVAVGEA